MESQTTRRVRAELGDRRQLPPSSAGCQALFTGLLISVAALASCSLWKHIIGAYRHSTSSLTEYAVFLRTGPEFFSAALAALSSLGLLGGAKVPGFWRIGSRRHTIGAADGPDATELQVRLANQDTLAAGGSPSRLAVRFERPDLYECLRAVAELGPVVLRTCGPERLLRAAVDAARALRRCGLDVQVDGLEAPL